VDAAACGDLTYGQAALEAERRRIGREDEGHVEDGLGSVVGHLEFSRFAVLAEVKANGGLS
jgi:hypothetical protein